MQEGKYRCAFCQIQDECLAAQPKFNLEMIGFHLWYEQSLVQKQFDDGVELTDCRTYGSADTGFPPVLDCRVPMGHVYTLSWS